MIICGQEFEFSALNADDLDRMETAQKHLKQASARESQRRHTGFADQLRGQCRLVMGYLDELLGEGASERLGLTGSDFGACTRVVESFKQAIEAEQAAARQTMAVPQNREQRRAQAKKNRPQKPASQSESFYPQAAQMVERVDDRIKTERLVDARQAMNTLQDDPEAMQQLADFALKLAAERHG